MNTCPCGSGAEFEPCCGELIAGRRAAQTAEELMRSRYTAYTRKEVDYIFGTTHPEQRRKVDRESIKSWADAAHFRRLEILRTEQGGPEDDTGMVEFIATYEESGEERTHHEHARFSRLEGRWYFDHRRSQAPRLEKAGAGVGRNDPCPCGSGRKYKKCCGKVEA